MRPHIRHVIRSAPTEPPPPPTSHTHTHIHTHVASPTMSGRTLCVHDAFCWGFALLRAPYSMCCFCFSECMKIRLTVLAHTRTHEHSSGWRLLEWGDASSVVSTHRNRIKIIMFVSACSLLHTHTTNQPPQMFATDVTPELVQHMRRTFVSKPSGALKEHNTHVNIHAYTHTLTHRHKRTHKSDEK